MLSPLADAPYPSEPLVLEDGSDGAHNNSHSHLLDLPHSCRTYKMLIQDGHFDQRRKIIVRPSHSPTSPSFARSFVTSMGKEKLVAFAKGNGTFVVLELVERVLQEGTPEEKLQMKDMFDPTTRQEIGDADSRKGRDALLAKLNELTL